MTRDSLSKGRRTALIPKQVCQSAAALIVLEKVKINGDGCGKEHGLLRERPGGTGPKIDQKGVCVCKNLENDSTEAPFDLGHHVLPHLAGRMAGYPIGSYLRDIGTAKAYHLALAEWPLRERRHHA